MPTSTIWLLRQTEPFPYKEVRTKRGADAEADDLANDYLNWLAWEFCLDPAKWRWVDSGYEKARLRIGELARQETAAQDRVCGVYTLAPP